MSEEKYSKVLLNIPKGWMPSIDGVAKVSGVDRAEWLRTIIRDALESAYLTLVCPNCQKSNWMVTRAGTRLLCKDCYREYKLEEVPKG